MDNYYLDKVTNTPIKICSVFYIKALKRKINGDIDKKEVLSNIEYSDYLKIKKTLPALVPSQFYCYTNKSVVIKNKSIKLNDFTKHLVDVLPSIIDQIVENINDSSITDIKSKIVNIFYNSLIH